MANRTVRIIDRSGWGVPNASYPTVRTVSIAWVCPVCGGPRGEPSETNFIEDGEWLNVHTWSNPCGHVDAYQDVLIEAGS